MCCILWSMAARTRDSRFAVNPRKTSSKRISPEKIRRFRRTVLDYYRRHGRGGRDLPWRAIHDPYRILVSEFMLQQTQVERVRKKYREFLQAFPTLHSLAAATLRRVLSVWRGLGYNRRAKNILRCAQAIRERYSGRIPRTYDDLISLPGVGQSTAGALLSFAFNQPTVFIETNIRAVFIHFFFNKAHKVSDRDLIPLLEKTMDRRNPRDWYYALMDYGVHLKRTGSDDPGRRSALYKKQSPFKGSRREVRGGILKSLTKRPDGMTAREIALSLEKDTEEVRSVVYELMAEKFVERVSRRYHIMAATEGRVDDEKGGDVPGE